MVNYDKCTICGRKGLYEFGSMECCFCGRSVPLDNYYWKMKRKELEWRRRKHMELLSSYKNSELYENNVEWRNMTAILKEKNIKKEWIIKYLTISISIIAFIFSVIAILFIL